jgi:4a-hydroxytetrahydrobiopterin dehydratase
VELVGEDQISAALAGSTWSYEGGELVKVVRRHDFAEALGYLNRVGALAEAAGHHPDAELRWNTLTLRLRTHSLGGITDADLRLAEKIDELD